MSPRSRQAVLEALARGGAATRLQLIARTALSRATITAAASELVAEGWVVVHASPRGSGGRGRKPAVLKLATPAGMLCGIDLGRQHIAVAVGVHATDLAAKEWAPADVDADPARALQSAITTASRLLERVAHGRPLIAATVVVPQPVTDLEGRLIPTPFLRSWHGLDVTMRMNDALAVPTAVENDANAGAVAEAGDDDGTTVFIKVSTGVGAGIVISGVLARGSSGRAGEIGHLVVKPDGQICSCGNRGCLETLASVPAIRRALDPVHGRLDESDLARLLVSGDTAGARAMYDAGEAIGTAIAPVVAALQVDRVVVSGPLKIPMNQLVRGVRTRVESLVQPEITEHLMIGPGTFGAFAPLAGAMRIAEATVRSTSLPRT